jgi:predicted RNase H-like HicB family nuclease
MRRTYAVPYTSSQDEDGVWCAEAHAGQAGVAFGQGDTQAEAVADLREGFALLLEDVDVLPTVAVEVAQCRPCRPFQASG